MTLRALLLASTTLLVLPATAYAVEPEQLGNSIKTVMSAEGSTVNWSSISGDDSEMVLEGVTVSVEGATEPFRVGTVRLNDIEEADGDYVIGTTTFPDYSATQDGFSITTSGMTIDGLRLPVQPGADDMFSTLTYDSADLENLTLGTAGAPFFTMTGFNVSVENAETEGAPVAFSGSTEELTIDLAQVEDPQAKAIIQQMGYQTLSGGLTMAGSYDRATGRILVEDQTIEFADAGALSFSLDVSGYTPEVIRQMREISQRMATATPEEQNTQNLAMLGLLQQITFNGMSLRYDDDSLTNKVVDVVASQQNSTPDQIKNQAKAIVPFGLATLQLPDFATTVTNAVNAFLDDPQSLEISAMPATGVPLAQLVATGTSTPQALIGQLNVTVDANQD